MLILTRKVHEEVTIVVGTERIYVVVHEIQGNKARLGFKAPAGVTIHRTEIQRRVDKENAISSPPTTRTIDASGLDDRGDPNGEDYA